MPELQYATVTTPDGPFTLVADAEAVVASGWTADVGELLALIGAAAASPDAGSAVVRRGLAAVAAYYSGDPGPAHDLPVAFTAGDFHTRALDALRATQLGERLTYTQLAERAGTPAAVRAAAAACARNPVALFIPCHRVIRTDGTLGGFRYGLPIKQALLDREKATHLQR